MSVGPCFGFCPVYRVAVSSAGTVRFEGDRHTAALGVRGRQVPRGTYHAISQRLEPFRSAGPITCDEVLSDQPEVKVVWTEAGREIGRQSYSRGCRSPEVDAFDSAVREALEQAGVQDWARQVTRPGTPRG